MINLSMYLMSDHVRTAYLFLKVKALGKVLTLMLVCSIVIISRVDSQSKFHMLTIFSGRHIGLPQRYTNMAFSYWAL